MTHRGGECALCGDALNRRGTCSSCDQSQAARQNTLTAEREQWDRITAAANEARIRAWDRRNR